MADSTDPIHELAHLLDEAGLRVYFHHPECAMWKDTPGPRACTKDCGRSIDAMRAKLEKAAARRAIITFDASPIQSILDKGPNDD